jgi:hypothetical protein
MFIDASTTCVLQKRFGSTTWKSIHYTASETRFASAGAQEKILGNRIECQPFKKILQLKCGKLLCTCYSRIDSEIDQMSCGIGCETIPVSILESGHGDVRINYNRIALASLGAFVAYMAFGGLIWEFGSNRAENQSKSVRRATERKETIPFSGRISQLYIRA